MKRKVFWIILFLILAIFLSDCFLEMKTLKVKNLVYDPPNKCLLLKNNNKTQYFNKN